MRLIVRRLVKDEGTVVVFEGDDVTPSGRLRRRVWFAADHRPARDIAAALGRCPYCEGEMCARMDGLGCTHNLAERHGYQGMNTDCEVPEVVVDVEPYQVIFAVRA